MLEAGPTDEVYTARLIQICCPSAMCPFGMCQHRVQRETHPMRSSPCSLCTQSWSICSSKHPSQDHWAWFFPNAMHFPLQPVSAPRHSSCVHSIILRNSNAESCTSSSKICQEGMQSLHFAVRKTKMEWGYNSPKHHEAGQWRDRNTTLEPDSWAWLCLLITLSTTVPSISIDFKLTHTHILWRRKRSNQEDSLCSSPLEANMILRQTFSARSPGPKYSRLGGTKQAPSRNYQMLIKYQTSWAAFQKI